MAAGVLMPHQLLLVGRHAPHTGKQAPAPRFPLYHGAPKGFRAGPAQGPIITGTLIWELNIGVILNVEQMARQPTYDESTPESIMGRCFGPWKIDPNTLGLKKVGQGKAKTFLDWCRSYRLYRHDQYFCVVWARTPASYSSGSIKVISVVQGAGCQSSCKIRGQKHNLAPFPNFATIEQSDDEEEEPYYVLRALSWQNGNGAKRTPGQGKQVKRDFIVTQVRPQARKWIARANAAAKPAMRHGFTFPRT
ncbi:hypothetical protein EDB83DRAFT_2314565 [Lactarius deliciosus]|nr:hypothetical protein EDB83DRAFT_2314565 [Lactarius deliciosus]